MAGDDTYTNRPQGGERLVADAEVEHAGVDEQEAGGGGGAWSRQTISQTPVARSDSSSIHTFFSFRIIISFHCHVSFTWQTLNLLWQEGAYNKHTRVVIFL